MPAEDRTWQIPSKEIKLPATSSVSSGIAGTYMESRRLNFSSALCANISETSSPLTITVGRGKKSHLDEHEQVQFFFRCVGSFGA